MKSRCRPFNERLILTSSLNLREHPQAFAQNVPTFFVCSYINLFINLFYLQFYILPPFVFTLKTARAICRHSWSLKRYVSLLTAATSNPITVPIRMSPR